MDRMEKYTKCRRFFVELSEILEEFYTIVESCNKDASAYLIPNGTEDQITWSGKPVYSFRISDHWNWKTNYKNNPDEYYIQCFTKELPWCKKRKAEGKASPPIWGSCVCFYGSDSLYHVVFGEKFDRKTKTWNWVENDPKEIAEKIQNGSFEEVLLCR